MPLLSFQASLLQPFASFLWMIVPRDSFLKRKASPIQQQGSTGFPESRSGENEFWAGGGPTKIPSRESGSRSSPGWLPIPNGVAVISFESCSAAPPDAISHYKSAPCSAACGTYELTFWKRDRSNGKWK